MREIVDGVFEVSVGFVHAHLVVTDDGVVLIDTGLSGRSAAIVKALRETRREVGEIRVILLTHRHFDHTGGLAELRRRSGATVVAHELDAPAIDGSAPAALTRLQRLMLPLVGPAEPAPVDVVLRADGPTPVVGLTAVHTPGHTAGHVSYLLDRAGGVLFAGDAAAGGRTVHRPPSVMSEDRAQSDASIRRLAALDFTAAVFGHGRAVTTDAAARFRALAG